MRQEQKDSAIAAAVTFVTALLLLLMLFFCGLTYSRREMANSHTPELMMPEEEELFFEPEIIRDLGEEKAETKDAPARAFNGEPDPAPEENKRLNVPGKNKKPAPPVEKKVASKRESAVKSTEPTLSEEEKKRVTSKVAKGFRSRNGVTDGANATNGAGGSGTGIRGIASGRSFKGCPKPDVALRHKVTVTVNVVIDSEGRVISARAKGGADASIRRACEQAARGARWSAKTGAPDTKGTITFSITPR